MNFWSVEPNFLGHRPGSCVSFPARRVPAAGRFIDLTAIFEDRLSLAGVKLAGCNELDGTMAMLQAIPANEAQAPVTCGSEVRKTLDRIFRPILAGFKQGLGVRIVITDPWPAAGRRNAQFIKRRQHGGTLHGAAIVRMQDQRLPRVIQSLGQDSPANQLAGVFGGFFLPNLPADNITRKNVQNQVQVVVEAPNRAVQVRNIPRPNLVLGHGAMTGNRSGVRPTGPAAMVLFTGFVHYPIKTGFGCNVLALISQGGDDLARRFAGIFGLVDYFQDFRLLFRGQLMRRHRSYSQWPLVFVRRIRIKPALIGPDADSDLLTGPELAGSGSDCCLYRATLPIIC